MAFQSPGFQVPGFQVDQDEPEEADISHVRFVRAFIEGTITQVTPAFTQSATGHVNDDELVLLMI